MRNSKSADDALRALQALRDDDEEIFLQDA